MTLWIDPPRWPAHGRLWSHLISDASLEELHEFAAAQGIPRRGFEGDHYDVPQERYAAIVAAGAREASGPDLLRHLQASGLRLRKRKGEKGIARIHGVVFPDGSRADVDLVRSSHEPPDHSVFAANVYVCDAEGSWLVVWSPRRQEWSAPGGWREQGESPIETAVRETLEETEIRLRPDDLSMVAYERFYPLDGAPWAVPAGRFLTVYRTQLTVIRPEILAAQDEPARWVTTKEFMELARTAWWLPIAQAIANRE